MNLGIQLPRITFPVSESLPPEEIAKTLRVTSGDSEEETRQLPPPDVFPGPTPAFGQGRAGQDFEKLGPYTIRRLLGQGGMGVVYLGFDEGLQRPAAIKVITAALMGSQVATDRLRSEAQAAARLQHPNIVSVYAFGEEQGVTYIAFEYVAGVDLGTHIRQSGAVPVGRALEIARQAAQGLRFATAHRIIHRDIKPANLLLLADGTVKIADFGLAKRMDHDLGLTETDMIVGSPAYMAPEQGLGESLDFRADIYSLGCTLYTALLGDTPFQASTPLAVMMMHAKEPLPEPDGLKELLDGRVVHLLRKMMAKRPEHRHASYDELIRDLDDLIIVAGGGKAPRRFAMTRGMAAAGLGVGALLLFGIFAATVIRGKSAAPATSSPAAVTDLAPRDIPAPATPAPATAQQPQLAMTIEPGLDVRETGRFLDSASRFGQLIGHANWMGAEAVLRETAHSGQVKAEDQALQDDLMLALQSVKVFQGRLSRAVQAVVPFDVPFHDGTLTVTNATLRGITVKRGTEEPKEAEWHRVPPDLLVRLADNYMAVHPPESASQGFEYVLYTTALGAPDADKRWNDFRASAASSPEIAGYDRIISRWTQAASLGQMRDHRPLQRLRDATNSGTQGNEFRARLPLRRNGAKQAERTPASQP
ncbi:serine/threonine protein kinase [Candidatus Poribacteria bacterium]|nr:serine/threonine protein kinase [Candidatus Poribacteria bacterium]